MIQINDKKECCGCTACSSLCSHQAIIMEPDELGFLYPKVIKSKCINCGLCIKTCQFHVGYERYDNFEKPTAYSFRLKDYDQLAKSQSGGAFYAIANQVLRQGGVLYGAAFTGNWRVTHQRVTCLDGLEQLRMSKYVQSDTRGVFAQVKDDLKNGNIVLFSGTACQVAGLKSFIPNSLHANLLCVDIICHGVPSPKIWEDYLYYLENKNHSKIVKACFRDKRFGWKGATESFLFANGKEKFGHTNNTLYFSGLSLRECCSKCYFTNLSRVGDITIGDFWNAPKESIYAKDKKGVSQIFINSTKGQRFVETLSLVANVEEQKLETCIQPQLQHPSKLHPLYKQFVEDYKRYGFEFIARMYNALGWRYYRKKYFYNIRTLCGDILRLLKLR